MASLLSREMSTSRPDRGSLNLMMGIRAFGITWMFSIPSSWNRPDNFLNTFCGGLFLNDKQRSRSPVPMERFVTLEPNASTTAFLPNRRNKRLFRCLVSDSLLFAFASPIFLIKLDNSTSRAWICLSPIEDTSGTSMSSMRCL